MSPEEAASRRRLLLESLEVEDGHMRRIAEALPAERLDWRPAKARCRPAGALAIHAARAGRWFMRMVDGLPPPAEPAPQPADKAGLLEMIAEEQRRFRQGLEAYSVESLAEKVDLGGAAYPRIEVLTWHRDHMIHHRAQLGLYLRLMGAAVPATYGPSGDDDG